jgi:hypothetical protein
MTTTTTRRVTSHVRRDAARLFTGLRAARYPAVMAWDDARSLLRELGLADETAARFRGKGELASLAALAVYYERRKGE